MNSKTQPTASIQKLILTLGKQLFNRASSKEQFQNVRLIDDLCENSSKLRSILISSLLPNLKILPNNRLENKSERVKNSFLNITPLSPDKLVQAEKLLARIERFLKENSTLQLKKTSLQTIFRILELSFIEQLSFYTNLLLDVNSLIFTATKLQSIHADQPSHLLVNIRELSHDVPCLMLILLQSNFGQSKGTVENLNGLDKFSSPSKDNKFYVELFKTIQEFQRFLNETLETEIHWIESILSTDISSGDKIDLLESHLNFKYTPGLLLEILLPGILDRCINIIVSLGNASAETENLLKFTSEDNINTVAIGKWIAAIDDEIGFIKFSKNFFLYGFDAVDKLGFIRSGEDARPHLYCEKLLDVLDPLQKQTKEYLNQVIEFMANSFFDPTPLVRKSKNSPKRKSPKTNPPVISSSSETLQPIDKLSISLPITNDEILVNNTIKTPFVDMAETLIDGFKDDTNEVCENFDKTNDNEDQSCEQHPIHKNESPIYHNSILNNLNQRARNTYDQLFFPTCKQDNWIDLSKIQGLISALGGRLEGVRGSRFAIYLNGKKCPNVIEIRHGRDKSGTLYPLSILLLRNNLDQAGLSPPKDQWQNPFNPEFRKLILSAFNKK
ncbi:hypothetical protein PPL_04937 [Heterostelium album PN500]|uniref:Uncharacterized protein n=1 Tax=Heterostelium pallidum (strain ATCC 26659 / Pp 5 / PN500) TaxID=670386 RepID=D3B8Z3_HETP5|nr:hypothetical protein PPL_04937 [Heterostelium album PN500]EFA82032.1 hypothetical protein PPL_04937 [Heterostelium album PN500]|eukprot:XP_020434149.1 hypothetical protein PPL_04937 [Heterostelium album PN500]